MPSIFVTTAELPESALDTLRTAGDLRVWSGATPMRADTLAAEIREADALVTLVDNTVDASVLAAGLRLRVVANVAVGFDNIDLDAARRRGIWVTNTPDVLTDATADLTFALILAVARRIVEADAYLRDGKFDGWGFQLLLGTELRGKTLGVVGLGRIGKAVAQRAEAFGMNVAGLGSAASDDELDALFASADVLTLHTPMMPATRHMVDARRLRLMKKSAILVNTARGPLVDEAAVADALTSGALGGAGFDVYENEPAVHQRLLAAPNTVLVPHIGSATRDARRAMAELAARNAVDVLAGRRPPNVIVEGRRE